MLEAVDDATIVIGEALVDEVLSETAEPRAHVGGSPLNVAVGLARLGERVHFLGRWGQDAYGALIAAHLQDNGVLVTSGPDDAPTSVATARLDATGAATYDFQLDWTLPPAGRVLEDLAEYEGAGAGLRHVHIGSIATLLEPGASTVLELARSLAPSATLSYDPNCRPTLLPDRDAARARAEEIVALADVVHASDEDLHWLYPDRALEETLQAWQEAGAGLVVVTRGPEDLLCATAAGLSREPIVPVAVADTVGAGDSFTAALLAALGDRGLLGAQNRERLWSISPAQTREVLAFAARAAAVTASRPGADPPRRDELG